MDGQRHTGDLVPYARPGAHVTIECYVYHSLDHVDQPQPAHNSKVLHYNHASRKSEQV